MTINVFRRENITSISFIFDATITTVYLDQCGISDLVHKIEIATQAFECGKKYELERLSYKQKNTAAYNQWLTADTAAYNQWLKDIKK